MRLVVDVDDQEYRRIQNELDWKNGDRWYEESIKAIHYGTPLPKGHGRLIDADELYLDIQTDEEMRLGEHLKWVKDRFDTAPTIIEADKESE